MLALKPPRPPYCHAWDTASDPADTERRLNELAAASQQGLPCDKCQMAVSYGVAPFCNPGKPRTC